VVQPQSETKHKQPRKKKKLRGKGGRGKKDTRTLKTIREDTNHGEGRTATRFTRAKHQKGCGWTKQMKEQKNWMKKNRGAGETNQARPDLCKTKKASIKKVRKKISKKSTRKGKEYSTMGKI